MDGASSFTVSQFYGTNRKVQNRTSGTFTHRLEQRLVRLPVAYPHRILGPTNCWKTFFRQNDAFKWAQQTAEDIIVFAYESADEISTSLTGTRRYIATSLDVFWCYYIQLEPARRHHYEIIPEGCPCRLYFDLEFLKQFNPDSDGDKMVELVINYVCKWLEAFFSIRCDRSNIVDLDASTDDKFSRHLIFHIPGAIFRHCVTAGNFVRHIFGLMLTFIKLMSEGSLSSTNVNYSTNKNFYRGTNPLQAISCSQSVVNGIFVDDVAVDDNNDDVAVDDDDVAVDDDDELIALVQASEQETSDETSNNCTVRMMGGNNSDMCAIPVDSEGKPYLVTKTSTCLPLISEDKLHSNHAEVLYCVEGNTRNKSCSNGTMCCNCGHLKCVGYCAAKESNHKITCMKSYDGDVVDNSQVKINKSSISESVENNMKNVNVLHVESDKRNENAENQDSSVIDTKYMTSLKKGITKHNLSCHQPHSVILDGTCSTEDIDVQDTDSPHVQMMKICGHFSLEDLTSLLVTNKDGQKTNFCDLGVYTKNRNFRLFLSSKLNKNNPLIVSPKNQFQPDVTADKSTIDRKFFDASLVSHRGCLSNMRVLEFDHIETQQGQAHYQDNILSNKCGLSCSRITQNDDSLVGLSCSSPYPEIDGFIESVTWSHGCQGHIRQWTYFKSTSTLLYDITGCRWCGNVQREHRSNNIMYVADLKRGIYYQKCYDPDCQAVSYKSPAKEIPYHLLPSSFFEFCFDDGTEKSDENENIFDGDDDSLLFAAAEQIELVFAEQIELVFAEQKKEQSEDSVEDKEQMEGVTNAIELVDDVWNCEQDDDVADVDQDDDVADGNQVENVAGKIKRVENVNMDDKNDVAVMDDCDDDDAMLVAIKQAEMYYDHLMLT